MRSSTAAPTRACVFCNEHNRYELFGRCLGNGGIPEPRKGKVKDAPTEKTAAEIAWKRLSETEDSPSCLALDGPKEAEKFVPHGFMTFEFDARS